MLLNFILSIVKVKSSFVRPGAAPAGLVAVEEPLAAFILPTIFGEVCERINGLTFTGAPTGTAVLLQSAWPVLSITCKLLGCSLIISLLIDNVAEDPASGLSQTNLKTNVLGFISPWLPSGALNTIPGEPLPEAKFNFNLNVPAEDPATILNIPNGPPFGSVKST